MFSFSQRQHSTVTPEHATRQSLHYVRLSFMVPANVAAETFSSFTGVATELAVVLSGTAFWSFENIRESSVGRSEIEAIDEWLFLLS